MLLDVDADTPPSNQTTNVFVALRPARGISEQIHADCRKLCARLGTDGARRPSNILHMTLLKIGAASGRVPLHIREDIDAALTMIRFPAFDVALNQALTFHSRKADAPFVLTDYDGATDAVALYLAVRSALQVREFRVAPERNMTPHVTLAYSYRRCPRTFIPPISWKAREFQLIESWTGRTKYVPLARWPLWESCQPSVG